MPTNKITVSIVEDHLEFQNWILEEISEADDIECISKYDVAEDALAELPQLKPDIVIMDLSLEKSDMSGIECMLRLKLVSPDMKFLVITSNSDEQIIYEALRVGAGAYLQKGEIPKKLNLLLREFHEGGAPMSPVIARKIIENFHKPAEDLVRLKSLTERESQTLTYLSKGFLYKETAEYMGIKEGTIKIHAHKIYKKLQVNNCVEAIQRYLNL